MKKILNSNENPFRINTDNYIKFIINNGKIFITQGTRNVDGGKDRKTRFLRGIFIRGTPFRTDRQISRKNNKNAR